jgi:hypothetical protein
MFETIFNEGYVKDFINEVLWDNEGKTLDYYAFYEAFNHGFATKEEAVEFLTDNVSEVVKEFNNNGYAEFINLGVMFTDPLEFANKFLGNSSNTVLINCPTLESLYGNSITLDEATIKQILSEIE